MFVSNMRRRPGTSLKGIKMHRKEERWWAEASSDACWNRFRSSHMVVSISWKLVTHVPKKLHSLIRSRISNAAGSQRHRGRFAIGFKVTCLPETHTRFVRKMESVAAWVSQNLKVGRTRLHVRHWEFPKQMEKKNTFYGWGKKTYRTDPIHGVWHVSLQKSTHKT